MTAIAFLVAAAGSTTLSVLLIYLGAFLASIAIVLVVSCAVAFIFDLIAAVIFAVALRVSGEFSIALAGILSVTALSIGLTQKWWFGSVLLLLYLALTAVVAHRAIQGEYSYPWIAQVSRTWSAYGGTSFRDANLSDTDFQDSQLSNVDISPTALLQYCRF